MMWLSRMFCRNNMKYFFSIKKSLAKIIVTIAIASVVLPSLSFAQNTLTTDPQKEGFKLIYCDGPAALNTWETHMIKDSNGVLTRDPNWAGPNPKYIPCDFAGAMGQVQHLMNIGMVVGVLAAMALFAFAGYLYVSASFTGKVADIDKAKSIFKKVVIGFVVMLSAWFIVYQLLTWLTAGSATALLNVSK